MTASLPLNHESKISPIFFYLTIFFLPTQFGKHFWPFFSLVLGQRVDYLSPTLYLTDILLGALFVSTIFKKRISTSPLFLLFVLYLSLTIVFSASPWVGWYGLLKVLEFIFFAWYVATQQFSKEIVGVLLGIGVIFESVLGILQYTFQSSVGGLLYFLGERTFNGSTPGIANTSVGGQLILRPYGTFSHPNVLGGFLLLGILLCFFLVKKTKILQKVFLALVTLVGAVGILFTFSRTDILLGILFVITGVLFIPKITQKVKIGIGIGILLGIAMCYMVMPSVFMRLISLSSDDSLLYRASLTQNSMDLILKHPLFGVGLNNFLPSLPSVARDIIFLQPVHNIFLLTATEIGIPGVIFVVGLFLSLCKLFLKVFRKKNTEYLPVLFSLISVIGIGMVDHYFLTIQQGQFLFALVIGITIRITLQKKLMVQ